MNITTDITSPKNNSKEIYDIPDIPEIKGDTIESYIVHPIDESNSSSKGKSN